MDAKVEDSVGANAGDGTWPRKRTATGGPEPALDSLSQHSPRANPGLGHTGFAKEQAKDPRSPGGGERPAAP